MKGQLSSWSRRNPSELLPQEFRDIRERAMGGVWDISSGEETRKDRIWLYGSTWLWMFDLSQDFKLAGDESPKSVADEDLSGQASAMTISAGKKRKRDGLSEAEQAAERRASRKNTAGAGGKVPSTMRTTGIGAGMVTHEGAGQEKWTSFEMKPTPSRRSDGVPNMGEGPTGDDDDDELSDMDSVDTTDDDGLQNLAILRREEIGSEQTRGSLRAPVAKVNGTIAAAESSGDQAISDTGYTDSDSIDEVTRQSAPPAYWKTYKYRPILGIVPLNNNDEEGDGLEVALVERTLWDVQSSSKEA